MGPSRKSTSSNSSRLSTLSSSPVPAISAVAVAQICLSLGFTSAEPSALRSLSSIASLYMQTLATSASSIAASKGRTQSNLLDLIRALEDLSLSRGFIGGSDPTRSLLKSSVLKDLRSFVEEIEETPFPKPIPKREGAAMMRFGAAAPSFEEKGVDPPAAHVPRWLPCYPDGWEGRIEEKRRERGKERRRWEEREGGAVVAEDEDEVEEEEEERVEVGGVGGKINGASSNRMWTPSFPGCWAMGGEEEEEEKREMMVVAGFNLERERERVRFKLWGENKSGRRKKKKRLLLEDDG